MREAFRGLTVRGRAFLAAGLTAVCCAVLLDQPPLVRVGVLLVMLPLVTVAVVSRGRYRMSLTRTVDPQLAEAGSSARVSLTLTNEGWIPTGSLLLEESLPYSLGSRPRFVVGRIGHGWRRTVSYQVRSDVRGQFEIGPMTVRVTDPFGMVELARGFRATTPFTVTPRVVGLTPIALKGAESASGDSRPREFTGGSPEDVTVREYHRGDDLRRVHWRTSARTGQLMVRREEQPWQVRATVFLDNRRIAHRGHGAGSSFESAVVAAASVAVHLSGRGFSVRLVTSAGESTGGWHSREVRADTNALLEELASVQLTSAPSVDASWLGEGGDSGLTVAVLGAVDDADIAVLRRVRHQSGGALALHLQVDLWAGTVNRGARTGTAAHDRDAAGMSLLAVHGWRAAALTPDSPLDQAWQQLGARASAASYGQVAESQSEPLSQDPSGVPSQSTVTSA